MTEQPFVVDKPTAVIDIGSNSVRLVVYENNGRAPAPLYNEKVICRLGEGLAETGRLKEENMAKAVVAISRYNRLTSRMGVSRLSVVATAAVREAENGHEFVEQVEALGDLEVRILSGGKEGKLAALGVLSANPWAVGVVGDMGGGSFELVPVSDGKRRRGVSLPLGALRIASVPAEEVKAHIDAQIMAVDWLFSEATDTEDFHVVGGSWRALARIHMAQSNYALQVLHGYEAHASEIDDLCRVLSRQSQISLKSIDGVPLERAATLPLASLVMSRYIKLVQPKRILFSAYGLREGVLFSELPKDLRRRDPLIEACRTISLRNARFEPQGEKFYDWLSPLFGEEDPAAARVRLASSILCDFGWRVHPDFRPDYALMETLRSPMVGLDHLERGFLALALRARYTHRVGGRMAKDVRNMIGPEATERARQVGLGLRFALTLTGGVSDLLRDVSIQRDGDHVTFLMKAQGTALYGKVVENRFRHLTEALGVTGESKIIDG
jgi:exopolyphosphatase/guanosine-5'-triphosphate,3'-diphosphate pyrophosphatase